MMRGLPLVLRDLTMAAGLRDTDTAVAAHGEEEFRAFYERTARPLWAYLSRITGDPQRADDFLQEAYYRFFRANTRYEIATNVARDAARRVKNREEVPLDEEMPTRAHEGSATTRIDVTRAMQQLAYAQGASHEEIATILGVRAI